jgi:D-ala D-ala ligase C-terminus
MIVVFILYFFEAITTRSCYRREFYMIIYFFLYNVIYIKSDLSKLRYSDQQKMVLLGSPYCLNELSFKNRCCLDVIHQISRDFHQIDPEEVEKIIVRYIKKYGAKNIRLLTNEDSAQLVCGNLREKYSIPGVNTDTLLPFVNKVISKERLENVVKIPKFIKFDKARYVKNNERYLNSLIKKIGFPMFAKPIDLVSSVETHFIPDMNVLVAISKRIASHDYEFEIDEFIDGELFHCDAMIIDGVVKFFMVGKCSFALSRFFEGKPVGSIPIANKKIFSNLEIFCKKVFKKLKCPSGAYHMEVFLERKSQKFVFLEIGARTGGALITKVYERLFDINIEEINYLIQMSLIKDVKINKKPIFAGFLNFPKIKGRVSCLKKPKLNIEHEFIQFVKPGDRIQQAQNLLDISCSILFWDKSYQKVEEAFEFLKNYQPIQLKTLIKTKHKKSL